MASNRPGGKINAPEARPVRRPRVFLGFREIAGYYGNLQEGFESLGIEADFFRLARNPLGHPFRVPDNRLLRLMLRIDRSERRARPGPGRLLCGYAREIVRLFLGFQLFFFVMHRYDIFIFGSNSTLCHFLEMPFLRLAGKKIFFVFHGSDCRPPYLNRKHIPDPEAPDIPRLTRKTRKMSRVVARVEKHAHFVINYPTTCHFLRKPFINGFFIGIPMTLPGAPDTAAPGPGTPVRALHAPTEPAGKGSALITALVEKLRREGLPVELRLVSGRPHRAVVEELRDCHFVIDQLYSDTPMAGFAAEAAFLGKPALVGGYYAESAPREIPPEHLPPTLYRLPGDIERAARKIILDGPFRDALGERARAFVKENWSPARVASRFLALARDDFPAAWFYDPAGTRYLHGYGLSEPEAGKVLGAMISRAGMRALRLSNKPALENHVRDFVKETEPARPGRQEVS